MGQFSWIYSDTETQLFDDEMADTYLLVPPSFHKKYGEYIYEACYDGYGDFGDYDVYDLIAEWNREFIPTMLKLAEQKKWRCGISETEKEDLLKFYNGENVKEQRNLGIIMACYDQDNKQLPCPIKITTKPMAYNSVLPSVKGWYTDDDDWDNDDEWGEY